MSAPSPMRALSWPMTAAAERIEIGQAGDTRLVEPHARVVEDHATEPQLGGKVSRIDSAVGGGHGDAARSLGSELGDAVRHQDVAMHGVHAAIVRNRRGFSRAIKHGKGLGTIRPAARAAALRGEKWWPERTSMPSGCSRTTAPWREFVHLKRRPSARTRKATSRAPSTSRSAKKPFLPAS